MKISVTLPSNHGELTISYETDGHPDQLVFDHPDLGDSVRVEWISLSRALRLLAAVEDEDAKE